MMENNPQNIQWIQDISGMYSRRYVPSIFWAMVTSKDMKIIRSITKHSSKTFSEFLTDIDIPITYKFQESKHERVILEADGALIELEGDGAETGSNYGILIAAKDTEVADRLEKQIDILLPAVESDDPSLIPMWFFYFTESGGATSRFRKVEAPSWDQIQYNYPKTVETKLDQLLNIKPPIIGGRMVLLHGVPGTGKTHAIR